MFTYDAWVQLQTEKVRSAVNRLACSGIFDAAVYCLPSNGTTAGELVVSTEPQTLDVLHFHGHGTRVSGVPTPQLYNAIWNACRRLPICPTA
jgi:hypothetical protein